MLVDCLERLDEKPVQVLRVCEVRFFLQAMMILTLPTDVIRNAGCEGKDTFTFNEHVDNLEFLSQVEGQVVYAKAHVIKVYELEMASLV